MGLFLAAVNNEGDKSLTFVDKMETRRGKAGRLKGRGKKRGQESEGRGSSKRRG